MLMGPQEAKTCACHDPGMALCRLKGSNIGPEGAAAISRSLASVPQLQTLQYVCCGAVCALVVRLRRRDPVAQGVRGGAWWMPVPVPVCGAGCVGVRAGMPVWVWCDMCAWLRRVVSFGGGQPGLEQHRARGCGGH